jgi:hypothetical protein
MEVKFHSRFLPVPPIPKTKKKKKKKKKKYKKCERQREGSRELERESQKRARERSLARAKEVKERVRGRTRTRDLEGKNQRQGAGGMQQHIPRRRILWYRFCNFPGFRDLLTGLDSPILRLSDFDLLGFRQIFFFWANFRNLAVFLIEN